MSIKEKKTYIESLRILATFAVVMIHICMTEVVNYSIDEIGIVNYIFYSIGYGLVRWAVPIFIMITGSLLLPQNKKLSEAKVIQYIKRMVITLLLFGTAYACIEIVFTDGLSKWYLLIPKALLRVLEMKSWDHLWYLYLLIGLYIMTPFTKAALEKLDSKTLYHLIIVLYFINYIIPTVNTIFGLSISKFWIAANGYYLYYLIGFYLTLPENMFVMNKKVLYIAGVISMLIICIWDGIKIWFMGDYSHWIREANCLIPFIAVAIFVYFKSNEPINWSTGKIGSSISRCSFGIYLLHPFYINILYKVVGITPRTFRICIGVPVLFIVVFLLSWITTALLKRIPLIKRII